MYRKSLLVCVSTILLSFLGCGEGFADLGDDEGILGEDTESPDTVESGLLSTLGSDAFNRANASDLGSQWAAGYTGQGSLKIVSNRTEGTSTGRSIETFTGVSLPGNQFAQITVTEVTSDSFPGALVRFAKSPTVSGYSCRIGQGARGYISKWTSGTQTILKTVNSTFENGDKVRCEADGSNIKMYKIRGTTQTLVVQVTDTTYTSGLTGIVHFTLNGAVDDFSAGSITAGGGSALLSWKAPTANTDNSTPADVAGYKVYSKSPTGVVSSKDVGTALTTTWGSLPKGTTTFWVTAYNSARNESSPSTSGAKTIN